MARVLSLISSDQRRGAEIFATELGAHLASVGHEVRVMALTSSGDPEHLDVEVAGKGRFGPDTFRSVLQAARWSDVVIGFGSSALQSGAAAATVTHRPFVYRNIGDPAVWGRVRLGDLRVGVPLRRADRIVALYPGAARTLMDLYSVDPSRIVEIPRGVPAARFEVATEEARASARSRLGLSPDLRWISYLGALSPEKDPLAAVAALERLPGVGLVVAGDGPLRGAVQSAAAALAPGRVALLGTLQDVTVVLQAAELLVLPSRTEGIPGAVIEAGLSGLPVVASAVGGVPTVVEDGVTGLLVPPGSTARLAAAIGEALSEGGALGRAARSRCLSTFSMERVGEAWAHTIDELLAEPLRPGGSVRVLQVIASPDRRGAEVFATQLADALQHPAGSGFEVTTVAVGGHHDAGSLPVRLLGTSRLDPRTLLRLTRAAGHHDVVVAHGSVSLWPGLVASILRRRPLVYRNIGDPRFWGAVRLGQLRLGFPLRRCDAVVSLFDEAADWVESRYRLGPSRVRVIPNAVDATRFPIVTADARSRARERLGLAPGMLTLGYIGALSPEKRPELAVRAAARREDALLLVAGSGPMLDELIAAAERDMPGRFRFLGTLRDTGGLFAALDALLVPSRTEGLPAVVIEAGLSAVPVVTTRVGGVGALVDGFGLGTAVEVNDTDGFVAAVVALDRHDPATRLGGPGMAARRFRLEQIFGMEDVADSWAELLRGLVSSRDRRLPG